MPKSPASPTCRVGVNQPTEIANCIRKMAAPIKHNAPTNPRTRLALLESEAGGEAFGTYASIIESIESFWDGTPAEGGGAGGGVAGRAGSFGRPPPIIFSIRLRRRSMDSNLPRMSSFMSEIVSESPINLGAEIKKAAPCKWNGLNRNYSFDLILVVIGECLTRARKEEKRIVVIVDVIEIDR